ncbi:hypothetical protein ACK2M2_10150 [Acinetobacter sp. TY1]
MTIKQNSEEASMDEQDIEKLHYQVLDIGRVVQQLEYNLTHADALDPDLH